jgi:hypothetical protein
MQHYAGRPAEVCRELHIIHLKTDTWKNVAKHATCVRLFAFATSGVANQMHPIAGPASARPRTKAGTRTMRNALTTIFAALAAVTISTTLFAGILV